MANLPPKPDSFAPSRYIPDDRHYPEKTRGMAPMRHTHGGGDSWTRSDRRSPPRSRSYVASYDRRDSVRYKDREDRDRERDRDREGDSNRRMRDQNWDRDRHLDLNRDREQDYHRRGDWRDRDRDTSPRDVSYDYRERRPGYDRSERDRDWRRDRPSSPSRYNQVQETSPRRRSISPRRTSNQNNKRPRSRSRSPRRDRSRSPSLTKQPKIEDHSSAGWHPPRSPVPAGGRTPKRPRDSRSVTSSPQPHHHRFSQERQHHTESKDQRLSPATSPRSGKRFEADIKTDVNTHIPNLTVEDTVIEDQVPGYRPAQHRRSPPRGPRNHAKSFASQASPAPSHQVAPPSKLERPNRSTSNDDAKADSPAINLRDIPMYKPTRNTAIEKEITRLQSHRAHLKSEYVQIARAARRSLHELDTATIELRALERRRKLASEHMDKARMGILGIDAVASTV